jgi:hypothetical protein
LTIPILNPNTPGGLQPRRPLWDLFITLTDAAVAEHELYRSRTLVALLY